MDGERPSWPDDGPADLAKTSFACGFPTARRSRCGTVPHSPLLNTLERREVTMHQIVLLTALSMTGGLFGGGRHCNTGYCGRPAWGHHYAVAQPCAYQAGARCVAAAPQAQRYAQAAPQAAQVAPQAAS